MSTISPSVTGGINICDRDSFNNVLDNSLLQDSLPIIIDMIDKSIDILESPKYLAKLKKELNPNTN